MRTAVEWLTEKSSTREQQRVAMNYLLVLALPSLAIRLGYFTPAQIGDLEVLTGSMYGSQMKALETVLSQARDGGGSSKWAVEGR